MITVNGWGAGGMGGGDWSVNGGDGERLLSKLSPTVFFENIDRSSCNDESLVLLTCTFGGIHPGRVEPASTMEVVLSFPSIMSLPLLA